MSTVAIVMPLACGVGLGLAGAAISRRLPPSHATWLISGGAVIVSISTAVVLALVASVLVGQLPELANLGHWSPSALHRHAMTEPGVAAVALVALLAGLIEAGRVAAREVGALRGARRSCRSRSAGADGVIVVGDAAAGAVAVPGRPGRVLIARSLVDALSEAERRIVVEHERAHLRHRHHWHRAVVALAAAANPLLAPLRGAIVHATERWADEAAAPTGDRAEVARTVARVALLGPRAPRPAGPRFADRSVTRRVSALLVAAPEPRPLITAAITSAVVLAASAAAALALSTEDVFELAGHIHGAGG
jgi:Zn-dependent protease with chaperone function